jgi:hypothetical protein
MLRPVLGSLAFVWSLLAFPTLGAGQETAQVKIGGGVLDITFDQPPSPQLRQLALGWIDRAAKAVTVYYARFPVRHVLINLHLDPGHGIGSGRAAGDPQPQIDVTIRADTVPSDLTEDNDDWIMTHEMVHLAVSSLPRKHHWIEEGLAVYIEPIARVRAGELDAHQVWGDMMDQMPQGQPAAADLGLDRTPTWGRIYWGGAIFCLLADVEIRKRTGNRLGLETALRGIVDAGGTIDTEWGLERVLATGDQALGQPILENLYEQMRNDSNPVDLNALWQQFGLEKRDGKIIFHDDAPLAKIRQAIMTP